MRGKLGWPKYAPDGRTPPSKRRIPFNKYKIRARLMVQKRGGLWRKYKNDREWLKARFPEKYKALQQAKKEARIQYLTEYEPQRLKNDPLREFKLPFRYFRKTGMLFYPDDVAADIFGVSEASLRYLISNGYIPEPDERGFTPSQLYFLLEAGTLFRNPEVPFYDTRKQLKSRYDLEGIQEFLADVWNLSIEEYETQGGKEQWHDKAQKRNQKRLLQKKES